MSTLRSTLIAALLAAANGGCPESEPDSAGFRHRVSIGGHIVSHDAEGKPAWGESFYSGLRRVPSEPQKVDRPLAGYPIEIGVLSATSRSANLVVTYRGDTRQFALPIGKNARATFGPDAVELSFSCEGTSIPPLEPADPILNESIVIRKYDRKGTKISSAWKARYEQERALSATQREVLRQVLTADGYLSAIGADCFEPGMEFEIGQGPDSLVVIVCLKCWKLRIVREGDDPIEQYYGIADLGISALTAIYEKSFPEPGASTASGR